MRSDRERQKRVQEHRATRATLKQTTADLEEMAKLANVLYETSQRMGKVVDYLLKEHGVGAASQDVQSFEFILNSVIHQIEMQEAGRDSRGKAGSEDVAIGTSLTPAEAMAP
jgi:adenosyl cobinamide kinase/adenosyl cobinamide phosphate guanylyltransferase